MTPIRSYSVQLRPSVSVSLLCEYMRKDLQVNKSHEVLPSAAGMLIRFMSAICTPDISQDYYMQTL